MNARILTAEAGATVAGRLGTYLAADDAAAFATVAGVAIVVVDDAPSGARSVAQLIVRCGGVAAVAGSRVIIAAGDAALARAAQEALGPTRTILREVVRAVASGRQPATHLRLRGRSVDLAERPRVMGILNVTPDSFFDGGHYAGIDRARARAGELAALGADIIDIGGQSYADGSGRVSEADERARVVPVVEALVCDGLDVAFSIDTSKSGVAEAALAAGAHLINDCSGLMDARMADVVARYDAALVVMHIKGELGVRQASYHYDDAMAEILDFLRDRLDRARAAGVAPESLVCDPGLEFGKDLATDLEILARFGDLASLGVPALLAASRKSFIGRVFASAASDLLVPSLATAAAGIMAGASLVRAHDVAETVQVATMLAALRTHNRARLGVSDATLRTTVPA